MNSRPLLSHAATNEFVSVRERCILKVLNEHVKHFPREAPKLDVIVDAGEANARDEFLFSIREAQLMSLDFPDPTIEIVHQLTGVHEFEARPTANYIESDISIYKTFSRESAKVFLNMNEEEFRKEIYQNRFQMYEKEHESICIMLPMSMEILAEKKVMLTSFVQELDCELLRRFPDYESRTSYNSAISDQSIFFHVRLNHEMLAKAKQNHKREENVNTKEQMLEARRHKLVEKEKALSVAEKSLETRQRKYRMDEMKLDKRTSDVQKGQNILSKKEENIPVRKALIETQEKMLSERKERFEIEERDLLTSEKEISEQKELLQRQQLEIDGRKRKLLDETNSLRKRQKTSHTDCVIS